MDSMQGTAGNCHGLTRVASRYTSLRGELSLRDILSSRSVAQSLSRSASQARLLLEPRIAIASSLPPTECAVSVRSVKISSEPMWVYGLLAISERMMPSSSRVISPLAYRALRMSDASLPGS